MEENMNTEIVTPTVEENTQLANDVANHIKLDFRRDFLVKPLDPVMVTKEFDKPIPSDKQSGKDENGIEATDYDKVEKEVKNVESDYRKGIVIKVPFEYTQQMNSKDFPAMPINVGDVILYHTRAGRWFDQLKDAQMVGIYDVLAVEK